MNKYTKETILKEITEGAKTKNIFAFTGNDIQSKEEMFKQIKNSFGDNNVVEFNGLKDLRSNFIQEYIAKSKVCIMHMGVGDKIESCYIAILKQLVAGEITLENKCQGCQNVKVNTKIILDTEVNLGLNKESCAKAFIHRLIEVPFELNETQEDIA